MPNAGRLDFKPEKDHAVHGIYYDINDRGRSYSKEEIMSDPVNHPAHYNQGKIEVIEFIEDKILNFHLGNAVKYIARAGKKDPNKEVEDLRKAIWYINRYLEVLNGTNRRPNETTIK